jgi:hypothetical protein
LANIPKRLEVNLLGRKLGRIDMAIILRGKTLCSICGQTLLDGEAIVASPHFIHDEHHPLRKFSDSGMHRTCFIGWSKATAFRAAYHELWPKLVPNHPRSMMEDGTIVDEPQNDDT